VLPKVSANSKQLKWWYGQRTVSTENDWESVLLGQVKQIQSPKAIYKTNHDKTRLLSSERTNFELASNYIGNIFEYFMKSASSLHKWSL